MYEPVRLFYVEKLTSGLRTTVIEKASIEAQKANRPVLHYFFNHSFQRHLTARALIESYIKQLLYHLESIKQSCSTAIIIQILDFYGPKKHPPSVEELMDDILVPLLAIVNDPIFILDGLDECNSSEIQKTLAAFKKILATSSSHVLIACREEIDITTKIQGSIRIRITPENVKADMDLFIEENLKNMQSHRRISDTEGMLAHIKKELLKKADRM
jgi:hypothetical protein